MSQVASPLQIFNDSFGAPLSSGLLYIGTTSQNPVTSPIALYWDEAKTQPAAQPLKISGGYIVRNGTPARVYNGADDYSMSLYDNKSKLVYFLSSVTSLNTLRADLAASSGASIVGFTPSGTGAVPTTVADFLNAGLLVTPMSFGAVGNGIADDTIAVQKALDYAAPLKRWVHGHGGIYKVSTVRPKSGQRAISLYLESIGPLTGGAVSFQPVVEIDGTATLKTDMHFVDCKANGRRDLFTNIDMNGGGLGEDGGMHAWRVAAGTAGGVTDILWEHCDGVNAGTAGLAIHNPNPSVGTADYKIQNLRWFGGNLKGNREHGWFADSFNGLTIVDADCTNNGTDLNTSDPLVHGNRGARSGGFLFGAGFDVESYTGYNGSLWTNLTLRNLDCRGSAMPSLLYNPIATNVAGYAAHSGITIAECRFDKGTATGGDRAPSTDYSFNALGNLIGSTYPYVDLIMVGNYFYGAAPQFNGVKGLAVTGGYINANTYKAHVYNCLYWDVSAPASTWAVDISPVVNPVFTKTAGAAGATIASQTTMRKFNLPGGGIKYQIEGVISGGTAAGGDLTFTTSSPISGMPLTELDCSVRSPLGSAVAAATDVALSGVGTITIDTSADNTIYFKIMMTLSPGA